MSSSEVDKAQVKRPVFKRILKTLLVLLLIFFGFLIIGFVVFSLFKDEISEKIVYSVSKQVEGELEFEDISISYFQHFPDVSLKFTSVKYFKKDQDSLIPSVSFETLYAGFDVLKLVDSKIDVTHLEASDGSVNWITKKKVKKPAKPKDKKKPTKKKPKPVKPKESPKAEIELDISLDGIKLSDISIYYLDENSKDELTLDLESLSASFRLMKDSIKCQIRTETNVIHAGFSDLNINDLRIGLDTDFQFNVADSVLRLKPSLLGLNRASFQYDGLVDLGKRKYIDLNVDAENGDVNLLRFFLTDKGFDNIESGDFGFDASIRGSFGEQLPEILVDFNADHLNIGISENQKIENATLNGFFRSGLKTDFSESQLEIDTLYAKLPGGFIESSFMIKNFLMPELKYNIDLKTQTSGIADLFVDKGFEMWGELHFQDNYHGKKIDDLIWDNISGDEIKLEFENFGFEFENIFRVDTLNASLIGNTDSIYIENLDAELMDSDIQLSGHIMNILDVFVNREKTIKADLSIHMDVFNFPSIFSYDSAVALSFPYSIKEIDIKAKVFTENEKMTSFVSCPGLEIHIDTVDARIEGLFPKAFIRNGVFTIGDEDKNFFFDYKDFDLKIDKATASGNVHYVHRRRTPDRLFADAEINNLILENLFLLEVEEDNELGEINGNFQTDLLFSIYHNSKFDNIDLKGKNVSYSFEEKSIDVEFLDLDLNNVNYNYSSSKSLWETFSMNGDITLTKVKYDVFNLDGINLGVDAGEGLYDITLTNNLKQKNVEGKISLEPFLPNPRYELTLDVSEFKFESVLKEFDQDSILEGNVNLKTHFLVENGKGSNWIRSTSGNVSLEGRDLLLNGLDLDDLLRKFERSQNFNLVDLGAVAFAGPIGLGLTKGSDFANMLISNKGDSTKINHLVSDWKLDSGKISIEDVAFATQEYRVVGLGSYDIDSDFSDFKIAAVQEQGCEIFSQTIKGESDSLVYGKVRVLQALIAPVTNLFEDGFTRCDPIYNGKVAHPVEQKKE